MAQITELEQSRDAVLENENPDRAAGMIQQLAKLRGLGVQSATVLVREGFVREFANGKALGSYAGLIALWRFATQGVVPEGAIMKLAS
jgi:transposase